MMNTKKITQLTIHGYRRIHEMHLDNLSNINVLSGINNSGKTSVLEVIGLMSDVQNRANLQKWALFRSPAASGKKKQMVEYMSQIFPKKDDQILPVFAEMQYNGKNFSALIKGDIHDVVSSGGKVDTELSISVDRQNGKKPDVMKFKNNSNTSYKISDTSIFRWEGIFVEEDYYEKCAECFNDMQLQDQKEELIEMIQTFDTEVKDIFLDKAGDIYINHCQTGILPLFAYGSGMQKALLLASVLSARKPDVILIDEIDAALNISALSKVISWFIQTCRRKEIQAFITTHNAEAIDAVLDQVCPMQDDIRIITLRNENHLKQTEAKVLTGCLARQFRNDYEMELRV